MQVNPGFGVKTVLKFEGLGNQAPNRSPSSLIVKFKQQHNGSYTRRGDDLILLQDVAFEDVLNNQPVRIKTLDDRNLTYSFDELINP